MITNRYRKLANHWAIYPARFAMHYPECTCPFRQGKTCLKGRCHNTQNPVPLVF